VKNKICGTLCPKTMYIDHVGLEGLGLLGFLNNILPLSIYIDHVGLEGKMISLIELAMIN
jgi:hypothetical protein